MRRCSSRTYPCRHSPSLLCISLLHAPRDTLNCACLTCTYHRGCTASAPRPCVHVLPSPNDAAVSSAHLLLAPRVSSASAGSSGADVLAEAVLRMLAPPCTGVATLLMCLAHGSPRPRKRQGSPLSTRLDCLQLVRATEERARHALLGHTSGLSD
jgi:hypothetical protein